MFIRGHPSRCNCLDCVCVNYSPRCCLHAGLELDQNMRQRGDLSWATDLNAFRFFCKDPCAYSCAYERLKFRRSCATCNDNPGGPNETDAAWVDAPRLFPKTHAVETYNDSRLRECVQLT